jgi:hypothetical protein
LARIASITAALNAAELVDQFWRFPDAALHMGLREKRSLFPLAGEPSPP